MQSPLFQAPAIELFEQPHDEAVRLVRTGAPVYLTVNPVEFHGPHLSLHNDRLVSRGLVRDLHARLAKRHPEWPLLLAADLEIGVEPCAGRGTRHLHYPTVRKLVLEACRALAELGAERVVLMSFHGAPLHNLALQAGVELLRARGVRALAPFHVVLRELVMFDDDPARHFGDALAPIADAGVRAQMAGELKLDFHAGFFETSMAIHYAPASVAPRHRQLPPCPPVTPDARFLTASRAARLLGRDVLARELEFAASGMGWSQLRPFPGYTGRPALANATSGAAFARHIIERYVPVTQAVLDDNAAPPEPIMAWAGRLSAGGRLGRIPLPAVT